jgi:hypothetical protein
MINFRTNEILAQSFHFAVRYQLILSLDMLFLKFNWHLFYYHVKKKVRVKLITNFHRSENIKYQLHA